MSARFEHFIRLSLITHRASCRIGAHRTMSWIQARPYLGTAPIEFWENCVVFVEHIFDLLFELGK